jgi:hypothetical protein
MCVFDERTWWRFVGSHSFAEKLRKDGARGVV